MTLLDIIALLLSLSAVFGYVNHLWLRLPHTIGIVIISLAAAACVMAFDFLFPHLGIGDTVRGTLYSVDFYEALMHGFLSALLFAGAVHVDLSELAQRKITITSLATIGVLMSTFIVGILMWFFAGLLGVDIPFVWWLVFGALISPTDPVAVLGIFKTVYVPPLLKATVTGESLFNDGVGVVVFTALLALASSATHGEGQVGAAAIAELFLLEAVGGAVFGLAIGWIAYRMMRSLDEHNLEVLITLALVAGGYAIALHLHVSGPIAMVVAGLFIGNHGARFAMSERTRRSVFQFWELSDEILNSVLFLLIGLELVVIGVHLNYASLGILAVPVVLLGRLVSVSIPVRALKLMVARANFTEGAIRILTWGGLRGGISVALALSLPNNEYKPALLAATYTVVVFSIVVQGLTMQPLVRRIIREAREDESDALKQSDAH